MAAEKLVIRIGVEKKISHKGTKPQRKTKVRKFSVLVSWWQEIGRESTMNNKSRDTKNGFTIVELLTVLAIIALLTGVLIPSLNMVRNFARQTRQKGQFAAIDQALMAFRSDYGYYPPSNQRDETNAQYNGALKLAEALVGLDLLGFHPDSDWLAGGVVYDSSDDYNLDQRKGPYLEVSTANAFTLQQIFNNNPLVGSMGFNEGNFVLCDSFGVKKITIGGKTFKAGTPILYYKANPSSRTMVAMATSDNIYDSDDNRPLIVLKSSVDGRDDPLGQAGGLLFYDESYKIIDPKVTARPWPYRADSYILISAGADGLYGTSDDICNF